MSSNSFSLDDMPLVPYDYGMVIKEGLFQALYFPQIDYWNKRLRGISERNVDAYAREDECFNLNEESFVSIFFENRTYGLLQYDEDDDYTSPFCLELFTGDPNLLKDMQVCAQEINKLKQERYEAVRFLSGLMMFTPHPKHLAEILGDGLSRLCNTVIHRHGWTFEEIDWDVNDPGGFKTFIQEQQPIITAMQERVLLNMITL